MQLQPLRFQLPAQNRRDLSCCLSQIVTRFFPVGWQCGNPNNVVNECFDDIFSTALLLFNIRKNAVLEPAKGLCNDVNGRELDLILVGHIFALSVLSLAQRAGLGRKIKAQLAKIDDVFRG